MVIESGNFYFLNDIYFEKFKKYNLMKNKENGNKRPCYFCFEDEKNQEILWLVPISSKIQKYKEIYMKKKQKSRKVYNFVFGKILNEERVFLIQNMFPTKKEYIEQIYQTKNINVRISKKLNDKIVRVGRKVILLAEQKITIPFCDIIEMRNILLKNEI